MDRTPHIMFVEGVNGEVREKGFDNWIYVQSVSKGIRTQVVKKGTALQASSPDFDEFSVSKGPDKASNMLFMAAVTGRHIPTIKVVFRRVGKMDPKSGGNILEPFYEWIFKDCMVSSFNVSGSGYGSETGETITFVCTKQQESFFSLVNGKRVDSGQAGWDMQKRTANISLS